jgi:copper chaperone
MSSITYMIPNINCSHCVHTIKSELSEMEGIKSVEADADTKKTTVIFDSPATEARIEALLTEINYPPIKGESF